MQQPPSNPIFQQPPSRSGKAPLGKICVVLAVIAVALVILTRVAINEYRDWARYDRPQIDCATFELSEDFWKTRHRPQAERPYMSVDARERQAAGAVDCVLKPGMSRREISELFGKPDELGVWSVQPERESGPTRHVRRWSTHRNWFGDVIFDGFDVWFDGPEHRRAVEVRLVHESQ